MDGERNRRDHQVRLRWMNGGNWVSEAITPFYGLLRVLFLIVLNSVLTIDY